MDILFSKIKLIGSKKREYLFEVTNISKVTIKLQTHSKIKKSS